MGCTESKETIQQENRYRVELKDPDVIAAMESLQLDVQDVGMRLYRVFAQMDIDGSHSIDLDEFHIYFGLPRTTLSDQVFSALGHQSAERDVTFDDFVLNMWNFCTMSEEDVHMHVFNLYDDDNSGTLDLAELESLFRLVYHTHELSDKIKQIIAEVDVNGEGVLSRDQFSVVCKKYRQLLEPVFTLQNSAKEKCLGKSFWKKEQLKRKQILAGQTDVFALARDRMEAKKLQSAQPTLTRTKSRSSRTTVIDFSLPVDSEIQPPVNERESDKKLEEDIVALEAWIKEQLPIVQQYLDTYCEKFVTETHLKQLTSSSSYDVEHTTYLRHQVAVCDKKYTIVKANLSDTWTQEQQTLTDTKHEAIRKMANNKSKREEAGQENTSLQEKLDAASEEITQQYQEKWNTLQRAATLLATRALARTPKPEKLVQLTDKKNLIPNSNSSSPRIFPAAASETGKEAWTKH